LGGLELIVEPVNTATRRVTNRDQHDGGFLVAAWCAKGSGLFFMIAPEDVITPAIENQITGTSEIARTTLRSVLGQVGPDELSVKRDGSTSGCSRSSTTSRTHGVSS